MLFLCIKNVPNRVIASKKKGYGETSNSPRLVLKSIITNRPLLILTAAHICTGFGSGMWFTLLFIFADVYLGLGPQFAMVYVASFGLSILGLPVWYYLAGKWGKQVTWITGMLLVIFGLVGTGLLTPEATDWPALLICMTLIYSGFGAFGILVPSLLSDIVDYSTWKFGSDRAATYFSLYTFINKTVAALGGALGLAILGWYSFDPTVSSHNKDSIVGLYLGIAWIPALIILLSIYFIASIPITSYHHSIIRRRLDSRVSRAASLVNHHAPS